ncbi:transcription factor IIIA-like [Bradysia coprophila]|uniref:transcription factor IIIA-like n=1 Tax=Bradysia coprophila TaxID=38358 RepID=UPI00187DA0D1|nr:transcription factor IIIA-like [Bradysia coprophila]
MMDGGTKKFNCTICTNSFSEELMLKKHIQRHYDGRYITCSIPNCNKGFTTKHQLTKHLKNAHPNKDSSTAPPRRIAVKRELSAPGKHNCYFESCDAHFETSDLLNEHLTTTHGLSIVKNAGKRTKMDVMFSEQLSRQKMDMNNEKGNCAAKESNLN